MIKPLYGNFNVGRTVKELCATYGLSDPKRQLFIAYQDTQIFPGSMLLQNTSDSRRGNVLQNEGVISVEEAIGFDFIRVRRLFLHFYSFHIR